MQKAKAENKRIDALDGLRGVAALIVLAYHTVVWTESGYIADRYFGYTNDFWRLFTTTPVKLLWAGNEAVLVFFIISGYVITLPYLRGKERDYKTFLAKRFKRLMLPYWAILAVTFLCILLFGGLKETVNMSPSFNIKWDRLPGFWKTVFLFLGFDIDLDITAGAYWSIVQEWRVTFVLPFVAAALAKRRTLNVIGLTALISGTIGLILDLLARSNIELLDYLAESFGRTNYYFWYFFLGAVMAKHMGSLRQFFADHSRLKVLALVLVPFLIPFKWLLQGFGVYLPARLILPVTALAFVILLAAIAQSPRVAHFFESGPLLFLGRISYSLYLTQTTFIVLFITLVGQVIYPWMALLIAPFFAIGFANLWYRGMEKPLGKIFSR